MQLVEQLVRQVSKISHEIERVASLVGNAGRQGTQGGQFFLRDYLVLHGVELPQGVFELGILSLQFLGAGCHLLLQNMTVIRQSLLGLLAFGNVLTDTLVSVNTSVSCRLPRGSV